MCVVTCTHRCGPSQLNEAGMNLIKFFLEMKRHHVADFVDAIDLYANLLQPEILFSLELTLLASLRIGLSHPPKEVHDPHFQLFQKSMHADELSAPVQP